MKRFTISLFVLFLLAIGAAGQSTAGTLRGRVIDVAGGVVVGADVSLSAAAGGGAVRATAQTDQSGDFSFSLAPGTYTIRVASPGFALYQKTDVNVAAGRSLRLDVTLNVALEETQVTVGEEAAVNTSPEANASALVLKEKDIEA